MERDVQPSDTYLKKLNTLLPAEVTGLYLFIHSLAFNDLSLYPYLFGFAVLIAVVFYFVSPTLLQISDRVTRIIYVLTFALWVVAIEISVIQTWTNWPPAAFVVASLTAIWTFVVPHIFDAIKRSTGPAAL